jgi:ribonucleoside-triphosphate reductase
MEKCTIHEKLKLGAILDKKCGGGQISHINIDAPFPDKDVAWDMLQRIADSGVIYFALNTRISVCKNNHGFYGDNCPTCGNPKVDTYQRIVGFLTPESAYSKERKHEFRGRNWYSQSYFDQFKELG